jgi:outer membrane protein TolC
VAKLEAEGRSRPQPRSALRILHTTAVTAARVAMWFVACCAAARAAQAPLDLRNAVQYALDHNPNLASRRATLASDEAQYAKDHAAEYPPVTALLENQVTKQSNVSGSLAQFNLSPSSTFSQNTAQIGTQWTIYNGSSNQIAAQRARRQVETDRADLRRAQQQLAQDVSNAYYTVASRRENVRLDAADRAYQEALLQVARDNERVGRVAGVDVLRSEVNALRSQATLATAQSDEATARESLAQTIGAPPDQPFVFEEILPEPALAPKPLEELVAIAAANRPDIAGAAAAVANARLADSSIDTDRLPNLQVNAAFGNQFSPTQTSFTIPGIVTAPATRGNPGFWQIGATETLQIGLIDYGSRHAQHRAAHLGIESAQAALDTARYAVETDVRQALRGAQTAMANLATAKQASALGAESARIAQLQYKNGLISLTDATQAGRDNLSAQNDLVNARVTYIGAIVHLRVALGNSDPLAIVDLRNS